MAGGGSRFQGIETRQVKSGTRYRAKVYDAHAKKHRSGRWRKELATARGDRVDLQRRVGLGGDFGETKETLDHAIERFLAGMASGTVRNRSGREYKPSVVRSYAASYRLHLAPALGRKSVTAIRRRDLQELVDQLALSTSASTVRNAMNPLRAYFRWACAREMVNTDPTEHLALPSVSSDVRSAVGPDEAKRLVEAIRSSDRPIWAAMFFGGLRLGEAQALRIEDIRFDLGVIEICRGWDPKEGPVAPKSRAAQRKIPISDLLGRYLEEAVKGCSWGSGLVFGRTADQPFAPSTLTKRAYQAWDEAGLPRVTPHMARHAYASLMIEAMARGDGLNAKVLSEIMGHSSISITFDTYGHLMPGAHDRAASALDALLAEA